MPEGFARKLAKIKDIDVIGIKAIGGSASLLWSLFIEELSVLAEYCILDLTVYDYYLIYIGDYQIEHMKRYIRSAIFSIRSKGIAPVILLIPPQKFNPNTRVTYEVQKQVAIEEGCYFFDGDAWLSDLFASSGISSESAFSDPSHLNPEFSELLARSLSASLLAIETINSATNKPASFAPLARVSVTDYALPENIRANQSSLLSLSFVEIKPDLAVRVFIGPCQRVCAIVVDWRSCSGKLSITGNGKIVKDLSGSDETGRLTFVARVVPLIGDVSDDDGYVTLAISEEGVTEQTKTAIQHNGAADPIVYISHLLVEGFEREMLVVHEALDRLDLFACSLSETEQSIAIPAA